jgi:ABC-type lipoprotein export system ATPase subunit
MIMDHIQCKDVSLTISRAGMQNKIIIDCVTVEFKAGRMVLIIGATGVGKSTFLHILAGLIRPTEGEVRVDGERLSRWTSYHRDMWRRKLGVVFQQPHLIAGLTVLENVCLPLIPRKMTIKEIRKKGINALEQMGLVHLAGDMVVSLSGGERQRIASARAIVSEPEMILADEPTAHQDSENVFRLIHILERYKRKNSLVIVASHDPRLVESHRFDDCFRIENGKLARLTNLEELKLPVNNYRYFYNR